MTPGEFKFSHRGAAGTLVDADPAGNSGENTTMELSEQERTIMRSPPGILALGALLDHIVTCDCSYKNVKQVWNNEENDTLRLAYQHHVSLPQQNRLFKTSNKTSAAF